MLIKNWQNSQKYFGASFPKAFANSAEIFNPVTCIHWMPRPAPRGRDLTQWPWQGHKLTSHIWHSFTFFGALCFGLNRLNCFWYKFQINNHSTRRVDWFILDLYHLAARKSWQQNNRNQEMPRNPFLVTLLLFLSPQKRKEKWHAKLFMSPALISCCLLFWRSGNPFAASDQRIRKSLVMRKMSLMFI